MLTIFIDYWGENYEAKCGREREEKLRKRQDFLQNIFIFGVKLSKSQFSTEINFIMQENKPPGHI